MAAYSSEKPYSEYDLQEALRAIHWHNGGEYVVLTRKQADALRCVINEVGYARLPMCEDELDDCIEATISLFTAIAEMAGEDHSVAVGKLTSALEKIGALKDANSDPRPVGKPNGSAAPGAETSHPGLGDAGAGPLPGGPSASGSGHPGI